MLIYTVHQRPSPAGGHQDPVLIKEGICWPAFLFTAGWALWHRLWRAFAAMVIAAIALEAALVFSGADEITAAAAGLGYAALVALSANDWRRTALDRRGYRTLGVTAAADRDTALRRYFDVHPQQSATPVPA